MKEVHFYYEILTTGFVLGKHRLETKQQQYDIDLQARCYAIVGASRFDRDENIFFVVILSDKSAENKINSL